MPTHNLSFRSSKTVFVVLLAGGLGRLPTTRIPLTVHAQHFPTDGAKRVDDDGRVNEEDCER